MEVRGSSGSMEAQVDRRRRGKRKEVEAERADHSPG